MENLNLQSLDFNDLKNAFKAFLKANPNYADYNFEASGISTLLNILAYNSHINGFYTKMLLDESFIDSAHTREALLSHAKRTGYVPRGRRSARADVILAITVDEMPPSQSLTVPRGSAFTATNAVNDTRVFYNADDVVIHEFSYNPDDTITFTSAPFTIFEGSLESYRFTADANDIAQRFVIKDADIDIDTIRVNVYPSLGSTVKTEYNRGDNVLELAGDSNVYFLTTTELGYYQVVFGDGTFGAPLSDGNVIECVYIASNGESGNGAQTFTYNPNIGNFESHHVTTISPSSGGMEAETAESLRFTIPHHYRRQNRIVTESDYQSVLLSEFRNIDSINVWGGETNSRREYGKVFVSIKPKNADSLTASARNEIKNTIVERYGVVGSDVIFVDPDFINVEVVVTAKIDKKKTNRTTGQLQSLVISQVSNYNANTLNRFGNLLSDVEMLDQVRSSEPAIVSLYSSKVLKKVVQIIHGSTGTYPVVFGNAVEPGVETSQLVYGGAVMTLKDADKDGNLYLVRQDNGTKFLPRSFGTVDYSTGDISFQLPGTARVQGYQNETIGALTWTTTPVNPDIETVENNIVRITSTQAVIK